MQLGWAYLLKAEYDKALNAFKNERIIQAFKSIKREDFLPDDIKDLAEQNTALPISQGQTISQPLTVAFMFELLGPEPGMMCTQPFTVSFHPKGPRVFWVATLQSSGQISTLFANVLVVWCCLLSNGLV